jgi:hypothetical protein
MAHFSAGNSACRYSETARVTNVFCSETASGLNFLMKSTRYTARQRGLKRSPRSCHSTARCS